MGDVFENKIFDKAELLSRLYDDEELVSEVVSVYMADTPMQIQSLRSAHSSGNQEQIVRQGHTIKGASSNVSALRMKEIAHKIEMAGKDGDLGLVSELLGELKEQFRTLQDYLSK